MAVTPVKVERWSRNERRLSRAVDRAAAQAEAAEHAGDAETARAWRRVLAGLELRIPEAGR